MAQMPSDTLSIKIGRDIVKTNLLPDDISPEAMFKRMMLVQKMFANERKRVLKDQEHVAEIASAG